MEPRVYTSQDIAVMDQHVLEQAKEIISLKESIKQLKSALDRTEKERARIEKVNHRFYRALETMAEVEPCQCGCMGDRPRFMKPYVYYILARDALEPDGIHYED
jgi:hypothetical protein